MKPEDLEFRIIEEDDGSLVASCINKDIFTQKSDLEDLKSNMEGAIRVHFSDSEMKESHVHLDIIESQQEILVAAWGYSKLSLLAI